MFGKEKTMHILIIEDEEQLCRSVADGLRMDGYETASRIRNMPEGCYKDIPIVILSADAFAREKVLDKRNHMNGFLCKPFTREALYETIYHSIA